MADRMAQVKIKGRLINIPDEGLNPVDLNLVVEQVLKKMTDLEEETEVIDTSKVAIMTAIHFAAELFRAKK